MSEKVGIDELKKLFLLVITAGVACGVTFEDKQVNMSDWRALLSFGGAAKDMATEVDFKKAIPQFEDIDNQEMEELMDIVEQHFDIPEDLMEEKVKQILGLCARQYQIVSEAIDMIRNPEAVG